MTRTRTPPWPVLGILALSGLAAGAAWFESGPDRVIYPEQTIEVFFPHDYHVRDTDEAKGIEGEGLSCDFCHENIAESQKSSDLDIPGHDVCEMCHDGFEAKDSSRATLEQCALCHTDIDPDPAKNATIAAGLVIPTPNIIFSHAEHVEHDVACTDCHTNVPKKTVATRNDYPTMDRCVGCHEDRGVSTECTTCHLSDPTGRRVQTVYAQGKLAPRRFHQAAIHDADFQRDHAKPAMRNKAYCENCHSESDCLECHDGVGRDVRYHPGDWMAMHSIRSRVDDFRCQSCHRMQSFCLNCHIRSNVASAVRVNPRVPESDPDPTRNPLPSIHPPDFDEPTSRNFHGFQAQRNIRACASCHQEQYCIRCHGVSPSRNDPQVNPHGSDLGRLRRLRKKNARACLKCHNPADPRWRE